MQNFVKGLFQSEQIDIADKKSKASFTVKSIESLANPLQNYNENEIVQLQLNPLGPMVSGHYNEKGMYDYLSPDDTRFTENLICNWRSKIETCYDLATGSGALLMIDHISMNERLKSRLITIKADTPQQTSIRGFLNFYLKVTAEKRFLELLLNSGAGLYNSMGCGCVEVIVV